MKRALWFGLCLLLCACSSSEKKIAAAPGNRTSDAGPDEGGRSGGSGKGGKGGGGGGGSNADAAIADGGGVDELAPSISFSTPTPADGPDSENVLVNSSVTVRCKAEQSAMVGSAPVDKSSIKITLQDTTDATKTISSTVSSVGNDEYEATFDLTTQKNGSLKFTCSAKDQSMHTGSGSMSTLLDLGPTIDMSDPMDKGTYALKSPFKIKFTVKPAPLSDPDDKSAVTMVQMTVGGLATPITESTDTPGQYETSINFADQTKYPVTPTTAQIQVFATDSRAPNAATRRAEANVTIDGAGPTIMVTSPVEYSIQHGNVPLVVSVTDPSGLMVDTLTAQINNKKYKSWTGTGPSFTQIFDTRDIDPANDLTQLTIDLSAVDRVGNIGTASFTVRLDNLPPLISLDPPFAIETKTSNKMLVCSQPFDPVGSDAPNDADHMNPVHASVYFRALIEDQTNHSEDAHTDYVSGTNAASVNLFLQPLPDVALLIDTDGDGKCDEIYNNAKTDAQHPALADDKLPISVKLSPVPERGSSWFAKPTTPNAVNTQGCPSDPGGSDDPPNRVCTASPYIYRVLPARIAGKPPAMFALGPSDATGGECTGMPWEIKGKTRGREGWMCAAVRAEDNIGNVGVSAPLRVCFDDLDSSNGTPDCSTEAPKCTENSCTIKAEQKFSGMFWSLDN